MRLNQTEIQAALSDENEAAENVRFELEEIILCECDGNIFLDDIKRILQGIPDRELALLEPVTMDDQLALREYALKIIREVK